MRAFETGPRPKTDFLASSEAKSRGGIGPRWPQSIQRWPPGALEAESSAKMLEPRISSSLSHEIHSHPRASPLLASEAETSLRPSALQLKIPRETRHLRSPGPPSQSPLSVETIALPKCRQSKAGSLGLPIQITSGPSSNLLAQQPSLVLGPWACCTSTR